LDLDLLAAGAAWNRSRPAHAIPRVKAKCNQLVPGRALERDMAHVHALSPAAKGR
jgi:hypothetical protein